MCPFASHYWVAHNGRSHNPQAVGFEGGCGCHQDVSGRLRHRVAFRTCQKEVALNGVRLWISEPPSCAEAAEYLSVAANDITTRTNGEAHQRLYANGHPWQKPPGMHLCNFLSEIWWTDSGRPAVVTFSCLSEGKGGRHYLWMQGRVWAQMRVANLFA